MNKLAKSLLVGLLENESQVTALYGGGFKPPTKGHFEVVEKTLRDHPEITKFYIVIGSGVRNNITQDESYSIWNIYKQYLPSQVEIVTSQSPLKYIKDYLEENPDIKTYAVLGTREGNEGDIEDFVKRKEFFEKYGDNVEVLNIVTGDGISGTNARKAATQSKEEFFKYIPTQLTDKEKNTVFGYVASVIKENVETPKFDYTPKIKSLTKYMIEQGLNIQPLPKVKFVKDDSKNAEDFFGKTAYYDPNQRIIVLYTMNRHPKDIMRSFAHEMIHHMQNCENRLDNITTQNTNEGGNLPEIEREAYEKGNMYFRNWTDTLTEGISHEIFLDIPKYNSTKTIQEHLSSTLHEITLNPNNAVKIYGDLTQGEFQVDDQIYTYTIKNIPNPYQDSETFYNIQFHPKNNITSTPQGGKENYIKILSTMYKIILDFTQETKPEYIGISSLDNDGSKNYHTVYANLTDNKFNRIPGYFRKDVSLPFDSPHGSGRMVVLKKTTQPLNEGRYDKISNQISSTIFNQWKEDYESGADASRYEETFETDDLMIDVDANISFIPELNDLNIDGGADSNTDYLEIRFEVDPKLLPKMWSEISMNLKDVVRHEIEHLTHGEGFNLKPGKFIEDDQLIRNLIDAKLLPKAEYFKLEKEVDAQLQGMYFRAKKEKRPFIDVLDTYLNSQKITPEEKEEVLDIWRTRAKALSLPKF